MAIGSGVWTASASRIAETVSGLAKVAGNAVTVANAEHSLSKEPANAETSSRRRVGEGRERFSGRNVAG